MIRNPGPLRPVNSTLTTNVHTLSAILTRLDCMAPDSRRRSRPLVLAEHGGRAGISPDPKAAANEHERQVDQRRQHAARDRGDAQVAFTGTWDARH